ncbi:TIGR03564 family F420-dependent LLM class oxidoreductase [Mycolicibacterium sp. 018/SC-01/001]|uniref:TIGR03564 family F420-dependent LLM class oxidoreductase n=1 Tax=Mycolicibacterium sp. 018/SC-01/001 TaxID=2592069 RepID=UPI00163DAA3B|nr:TIGR03564 family F420-dependent LLM class oxidoreductase [Mycolicibacterium sp. 018/SC-01/001]
MGIGVSHRWVINDVFGYDFSAPAAFLREYLEVMIPAVAGKPVEHHGARITAVGQLPPSHAAPPPILVAALGPRMLRIAGELADGTITTWTGPTALEEHIVPAITKAAESAGRPAPRVVAGLPVSITADPDGTRERLEQMFGSAADMPSYRAVLDREGVRSPADISLFGDEDTVLAHVRRFAEIGVTEFSAMPFGNPDDQARTIDVLAAQRDSFA